MFFNRRSLLLTFEVNDYRKENIGVKHWNREIIFGYIRSRLDPITKETLPFEDILIIMLEWILNFEYCPRADAKEIFQDSFQAILDDVSEDIGRAIHLSDQEFNNALIVITDLSNAFENSFLRAFETSGYYWPELQVSNLSVQERSITVEFIDRDEEV